MIDPEAHTLTARSAVHAARRPDHVALVCEDRELTYAQLHRESNRTGHALLAAGLRRGARVVYLGRESEYYYDLALGCAKSGTVLVPINWRLTAREVDHVLRDSRAELIFVEEEFRPVVERVRAGVAAQVPSVTDGTVVTDVPVVTVDTPGTRAGGFLAWKAGFPDTDLDPGTGPDDPVVQMYTSGTTGLPKGVVLAHRTYFVYIENIRRAGNDWIDWLPTDRALIAFPGLHSGGMAWFLHGFVVGWTSVVMRMFVPEEAVRLIRRHRITNTFAAPAMLQMMLDERGATPETFASLRKVVYGGAPMPEALMLRCVREFGCELAQMYASAETGSVVTALAPHEHVAGHPKLGTAGRVCPGNEVRIVDEHGRALPAGEIGQVCVRTPARFLEYWNRPDATAETLCDGWLHMPDAGYLDPDGYLVICDRVNDMIIVAGQNIYPVEVENAIRTHPDVLDAAVIGVADPRWGEVVQAVVVTRPGGAVTGRDLMRWLHGRIADFKIPNRYEFVDQLPRNPTGKVLRRELRERAATAAAGTGAASGTGAAAGTETGAAAVPAAAVPATAAHGGAA